MKITDRKNERIKCVMLKEKNISMTNEKKKENTRCKVKL